MHTQNKRLIISRNSIYVSFFSSFPMDLPTPALAHVWCDWKLNLFILHSEDEQNKLEWANVRPNILCTAHADYERDPELSPRRVWQGTRTLYARSGVFVSIICIPTTLRRYMAGYRCRVEIGFLSFFSPTHQPIPPDNRSAFTGCAQFAQCRHFATRNFSRVETARDEAPNIDLSRVLPLYVSLLIHYGHVFWSMAFFLYCCTPEIMRCLILFVLGSARTLRRAPPKKHLVVKIGHLRSYNLLCLRMHIHDAICFVFEILIILLFCIKKVYNRYWIKIKH